MRRMMSILLALLLLVLFLSPSAAMAARYALPMPASTVEARGAILIDASSGAVLFEKEADRRVPIASVTKIMTLLLTFEAIDSGRLSLEQMVMVSPNAAGMGGSQAFLDAGASYSVEELIKSIIIASANDSSVVLAETIAGSADVFVARMNERAAQLGMVNTLFSNATGLPGGDHYSTARDVALMGAELVKHPTFFEYSKIWLETLTHPGGRQTELTNTNRLTRMMEGADGIKTGFTNEAMHCVAGSARRGDMRLIAVILGAPSSAVRFSTAQQLLEYGFANYESRSILYEGQKLAALTVVGGKQRTVDIISAKALHLTVEKGTEVEYEVRVELPEVLKAPVQQGQQVGTATVFVGERTVGEVPLITNAAVEKATFWDTLRSIAAQWK